MYMNAAVIALALAELGAASAVSASGSHDVMQKRSFSVKRAPEPKTRNIVRELKRALNKHNIPIPDGLANANESEHEVHVPDQTISHQFVRNGNMNELQRRQFATPSPSEETPAPSAETPTPGAGASSGSVQNMPVGQDQAYPAQVSIGGQQLTLNFDTGSSDLWVYSNQLSGGAQGHNLFNPQNSQTWKPMPGESFKLNFVEGTGISGNTVGTDVVTVGGVSVPNQVVELPSTVAQSLLGDPYDGLIGLAPSTGNTVTPDRAKTFLENVAPTLDQPVMGVNFKHAAAGSYDFGKLGEFQGTMQWLQADTSKGSWSFPSTQFAVGNGAPQTNANARPAIADTGTTLMIVDDTVAKAYWSQVQGAQAGSSGIYTFPCDAQLPDFHLQLAGSQLATIPGALMNWAPANSMQRKRFARRVSSAKARRQGLLGAGNTGGSGGGGMCQGAMYGSTANSFQIYGDIMFKAQYVAFNPVSSSIGFAPH